MEECGENKQEEILEHADYVTVLENEQTVTSLVGDNSNVKLAENVDTETRMKQIIQEPSNSDAEVENFKDKGEDDLLKENGEQEIADNNREDANNDDSEVAGNDKISDKPIERLTSLPLSRIKSIMKFDDDVHYANSEAVFLITRATELFIKSFIKEAYQYTVSSKKKTIAKRDVDAAIFSHEHFYFLDGALD